jgi:hypothetical protein
VAKNGCFRFKFVNKIHHNIRFQENSQYFRRKVVKIAKMTDHKSWIITLTSVAPHFFFFFPLQIITITILIKSCSYSRCWKMAYFLDWIGTMILSSWGGYGTTPSGLCLIFFFRKSDQKFQN